ncbi:MAG TPA: hypothetical protein VGI45_07880 [Terracidiphilus sp.]
MYVVQVDHPADARREPANGVFYPLASLIGHVTLLGVRPGIPDFKLFELLPVVCDRTGDDIRERLSLPQEHQGSVDPDSSHPGRESAGAPEAFQMQIRAQESLLKDVFRILTLSDDEQYPMFEHSAISLA